MGVMVVYKTSSEHARGIEEYMREFERRTGKVLETIDPDSRRGTDICRLYDVVEYPTIIATSNDGQLLRMWRGVTLPLIDEVSSYVV